LQEEILTKFFVANGTNSNEYQMFIRMPSIEYHIPSLNFLFMRFLSVPELFEYFDTNFFQWDSISLRNLMQFRKFTELVR